MERIIISLLLFVSGISAQWSTNPATPQSLGSGIQAQLAPTSDGGLYVAWLSDGNNYQVYLQRLNSSGEPQWDDNGMVVSDNANASWIAVFHLNLAVDSEDNAIITTVDQRTGGEWEVYAYKIDPTGSLLWGDDGVALTSSGLSNMSPRLTVLPENSVVVTWAQGNTVLFQSISSDGDLLWDTGIHIVEEDANLLSPQPIVTLEGDVLIQWIRQTGPFWAANSELYLQKYDYDGNPQWINPIVAAGPVVFPMGNWQQQSIADADNGNFSGWTEMSGSVQNAAVQHITEDGVLSWTGGVDLSTNSSNFRISPQLTFVDDAQELVAVWREANGSQSQHGVFAQRLDSNGNRLWGPNGTTVVGLNSNYDYLDLSVAGFGDDMIAVYIEQSVNMNGDIFAARLDADGNYDWASEAATITNSSNPKSDMVITKGPGCLFIAWTEGGSVYIHCLREDGMLGVPGGVLLVPSEYETIQEAIDAASDGETVLVAAGTYVENINYNGKNIVVQGENRETTIIDGNQNGSVVTFNSGEDTTAVLSGFTIQNGSNFNGGGIYCLGSSPTIMHCTITGNSAVEGGGIKCGDSSSPTITNCTISENTASGNGGGFCLPNSSPTITNCTITGNSAVEGGGIFSYFSSETITNCILWNNSPGEIAVSSGDGPTASYSDIQGGYTGTGNIDANPLFCAPDSGDYTLAENSPCIGSGENGANIGAFGEGCDIIGPYILLTNDSLIVLEDSSSTINLLDNDLIIDVTTFTLAIVDSADNGAVVIIGDSVIIYTPYENFFGYDTLSYSVFSSETADTGLVLITVTAIADAPTSFTLNEQDSVYITMNNFDSDSIVFTWDESADVDGDGLTYHFTAELIINGQLTTEYDTTLTANVMKIDYQSVFDEIYAAQAMMAGIEWDVSVSDGIEEVMAENGPLTVGINASDAVLKISEELLPKAFALRQNYPNPFNPITALRYELPETGLVNITIYDILGRQIKTLINQNQDAGFKSVIWDATNDYGKSVSAGIYLYQIQAGEYISTKKMVLLK